MIGDAGRGHCVLCLSCSPGGFGAMRESCLQWEQAAAACWRALPLTLFIPTAGVTSSPASASRTHIHTCAPQTHTHTHTCKTTEPCARLHTHTDECMCVCVWVKGDLELLTENKEENQEKMQPLRINLTTMLSKNPQPHPRNARKTLFLSFKAVKSVLQKQK